MSTDPEIRKHVVRVVNDALRNATAGQRAVIADRIIAGYKANPASASLATSELGAAHDLAMLLKAEPDLVRDVPTTHTLLSARAAEHVETYGSPASAEQRMAWHREFEKMTPDERLQTGIKAAPVTATADAPKKEPVPLHQLDAGSDVFDQIIFERLGAPPGSLTAGKRLQYVKAIQQGSQTFGQARDEHAAAALDNIEQAKPLSPAERLTQFRLAQKAK